MIRRLGGLIVLTAAILLTNVAAASALSFDTSFDDDGISSIDLSDPEEGIVDAVVLPDGSTIALVKAFFHGWSVVKLSPNGEIDRSFANAGVAETPQLAYRGGEWQRVHVDPEGRVFLSGWQGVSPPPLASSYQEPILIRYSPDGTRDLDFGGGGVANGIARIRMAGAKYQYPADHVLAGDRIYITGSLYSGSGIGGQADIFVSCLFLESGDPCADFGAAGSTKVNFGSGRGDRGDSIVVDSSGRPVVGATVSNQDGANFPAVLRFLPSGELDQSFAGDGTRVLEPSGYSSRIALDSADSIVVAREGEEGLVVSRLSASGDLDTSFGTVEVGAPLFSYPRGYDIVATIDRVFVGLRDQPDPIPGVPVRTAIAAIHANGPDAGELIADFGEDGFVIPRTSEGMPIEATWLRISELGSLHVGGSAPSGELDRDAALIAVDSQGELEPGREDTTTPLRGPSNPTGLIRVAGGYRMLAEPRIGRVPATVVAGFELDGSLDQSFAPVDDNVLGSKGGWSITQLIADPQGRALVSEYVGPSERSLVRLTEAGEVDPSFGNEGLETVSGSVYVSGGEVYAEQSATLARLTKRGRFEPLRSYVARCGNRLDLGVDSEGNLLELCDRGQPGETFVRKLDTRGRRIKSFGDGGRRFLNLPGVPSTMELEVTRRQGFIVGSSRESQPGTLQFERLSSNGEARSEFLAPDVLGERATLPDGWFAKDGSLGFYALANAPSAGPGTMLFQLNPGATQVEDTFELENSSEASGLIVGQEGISFAAELPSGSAAIVRLQRDDALGD